MQDRVSTYPGRVTMTPVAGKANTYDMERADEPTQAGTPLNKATLLKDATAALYGLGSDAVPDDVLAILGKYRQYWWKRRLNTYNEVYIEKMGENLGDAIVFSAHNTQYPTITIQYADGISVDPTSGAITLVDPLTLTVSRTQGTPYSLVGRYFKSNNYGNMPQGQIDQYICQPGLVYYCDPGSNYYSPSISSWECKVLNNVHQVTSVKTSGGTIGEWDYVRSSDRNAYPDSGIQGDYEYQFLGIPFDNAVEAPKIATGSYVGTGTYGEDNPNSLTFDFEPRILVVICRETGYGRGSFYSILTSGVGIGIIPRDNSLFYVTVSGTDNGVSYYADAADNQMNLKTIPYDYCAIG